MSFERSNFNSISRMTTAPKPVWLTYVSTDDALATIAASGYFNAIANEIDTNDIIYVVGSDGTGLYRFTSANGVSPVTVSAFDSAPAGSITPADLNTAANYKVVCIPVSFASGQQATHTLYFPMAVTVARVRSFVTSAIAGTDNATITCSNNAGSAMTGGVVTIDASSAVATEDSATPTTNNTFTAGQKMQLACAKTTAGGTANVFVEFYTTG
jgi:hypothetical protein